MNFIPFAEKRMSIKYAETDHPINELISQRWSPYVYDGRPVSAADCASVFEAARWAASSYNEQPWAFIVATRENPDEHQRMLHCLVEPNQEWAQMAPVLALGVVKRRFERNNKPNGVAEHDLGLAVGNIMLQATARGLCVHAMAGILPDKARETYNIPGGWDALVGLAIGYAAENLDDAPEALGERDAAPRTRKSLSEFVFGGAWGSAGL